MSVVNRMLQDIDRRLAASGSGPLDRYPDIRSVPVRGKRPAARGAPWLLFAAAVAIGAAALYGLTRPAPQPRTAAGAPIQKAAADAPPAMKPPAPSSAPAAVPLAAAVPAEAPPIAPAGAPPPAVAALLDTTLGEPRARAAAAPAPVPRPVESFRLAQQLSAAATPAPAAPARPPEIRRTELPVRRVAPEETAAAAQALWNDGARADAVATLREALATAEAHRNAAAAGRIARELARLELANDQPRSALELLRSREASLAADADAWALRGNAAQRVALHGEAAQSYLAALRLRPDEGKWMLGAAVSLAAEGRLEEARPWVQLAHERGAVTPAIAAYLQQLGLSVRPEGQR